MCEPWPVKFVCENPPDIESEQYAGARDAAQSLLWSLTGSRFGSCTVTERYRAGRAGDCGMPYKDAGTGLWHNGARSAHCCRLRLANAPVQNVARVVVHGVELAPGTYWLEGSELVRSGVCWPVGAECDPPPIEVTYTWGISLAGPIPADPEADPPVPATPAAKYHYMAAYAMGEVIKEMVEGMCGRECKLPSRVASVTRQGVTVNFVSPTDLADAGLLGLVQADAFIRAVNPHGKRMRSKVYVPGGARRAG